MSYLTPETRGKIQWYVDRLDLNGISSIDDHAKHIAHTVATEFVGHHSNGFHAAVSEFRMDAYDKIVAKRKQI